PAALLPDGILAAGPDHLPRGWVPRAARLLPGWLPLGPTQHPSAFPLRDHTERLLPAAGPERRACTDTGQRPAHPRWLRPLHRTPGRRLCGLVSRLPQSDER